MFVTTLKIILRLATHIKKQLSYEKTIIKLSRIGAYAVSYTHLRAHETVLDLVCRLLLATKKTNHTLNNDLMT